ncbi:hypothetical protein VCHA53O466_40216 [Vibrio chagasii]|nr:hypothetical protein VCHA53O466_40216 [Vibrio chagasii]
MSDLMLHGVLNMPVKIWSDTELDKAQRHERYTEASVKILAQKDLLEGVKVHLLNSAKERVCTCSKDDCIQCSNALKALALVKKINDL